MGNEIHHLSVNDRSIVFKKSSFLSEEEIKTPFYCTRYRCENLLKKGWWNSIEINCQALPSPNKSIQNKVSNIDTSI